MNGHHSVALQFSSKILCTGWCFVVSNIGIVTDCKLFSLLSAVMPSLRGGRQRQRSRERPRRIHSKSAPPAILHSPRHGKHKQWAEDSMLAALEAARAGCIVK